MELHPLVRHGFLDLEPCGKLALRHDVDLGALDCRGGAAVVVRAQPRRVVGHSVESDAVGDHIYLDVVVVAALPFGPVLGIDVAVYEDAIIKPHRRPVREESPQSREQNGAQDVYKRQA